jgi:copper chaperone for superoxide dismutase
MERALSLLSIAGGGNLGAAVAMLGDASGCGFGILKGVIRFLQTDENTCVVDGTLDGLSPGLHGLHIHECGDISQGCDRYLDISYQVCWLVTLVA